MEEKRRRRDDEEIEIGEHEHERYDRQIRLWGLDGQNRLRNSNVLLVGMGGVGAEVAKNLMLCGLKSMTLLDDRAVDACDYSSQFLLAADSLGKNRAVAFKTAAQELNPMVELTTLSVQCIASNVEDQLLRDFDAVIVTDQQYATVRRLNKLCRLYRIGFMAGGVSGWSGYAFNDFDNEEMNEMPEVDESKLEKRWQEELHRVKMTENELGERQFTGANPQRNGVCTVVGAVIAGEAIKMLTKHGAPFNNFFTYSALDQTGNTCKLP